MASTQILSFLMTRRSEKDKPVLGIRVKPFTSNYDLTSSHLVPLSKSSDSKVIKSGLPLKVKEVHMGAPWDFLSSSISRRSTSMIARRQAA